MSPSYLPSLLTGRLRPEAVPPAERPGVATQALGEGLGPALLWALGGARPLASDHPAWQALEEAARPTTAIRSPMSKR